MTFSKKRVLPRNKKHNRVTGILETLYLFGNFIDKPPNVFDETKHNLNNNANKEFNILVCKMEAERPNEMGHTKAAEAFRIP